MVLALDPGKNIGVALVSGAGVLERGAVTDLAALATLSIPEGAAVVVGGGTGSEAVQRALRARRLVFAVIDEAGSSLEGRALYFRDHPPKGLWQLVPEGLRTPPRPIDDYAAYALALRYLGLSRYRLSGT